jgi:hypothetical protein
MNLPNMSHLDLEHLSGERANPSRPSRRWRVWVRWRAFGSSSSRNIVVNAKVLLDSADALQEVIDFLFRAATSSASSRRRMSLSSLNICESFAHLDTQRLNIVLRGHLREN